MASSPDPYRTPFPANRGPRAASRARVAWAHLTRGLGARMWMRSRRLDKRFAPEVVEPYVPPRRSCARPHGVGGVWLFAFVLLNAMRLTMSGSKSVDPPPTTKLPPVPPMVVNPPAPNIEIQPLREADFAPQLVRDPFQPPAATAAPTTPKKRQAARPSVVETARPAASPGSDSLDPLRY